ncbi:MAG: phosphoribosylanthranilate isomerase [Gammaproteobacteria bacterium]
MRTRVKICGITRPEDALAAARAGADAIGLVFYPPSPRAVTRERAREIVQVLPPFVSVVGLFVNAQPAEVRAALAALPIDLLQFHGDEAPEECRIYGRPYIKAVAMAPGVDLQAAARRYVDAAGLLLDTHREGVRGGTGEVFDWSRIPPGLDRPIILAGGLTLENVAAAVQRVRPYAVDVSSGVEVSKGIKDAARIEAFIRGVNSVDSERAALA